MVTSSDAARKPFGSRLLGRADQSPRALRVRVQLLLTALLVGTNVVGAGVVFVVSSLVVPAPTPTRGTVLSLAIGVPVYVLVAVLVGGWIGTTTALGALRWASTGADPTSEERDRALRVPLRLTQMQVALWAGATVLFTGLALALQPERALTTALSVAIGGAMVGAVAYLFTQFVMRPVAARALSSGDDPDARPRLAGVGTRMVVLWCVGTGVPVAGLVAAALLALTGDDNDRDRLPVSALVLGGVVLLFGLLVTVLTARAVVAPVESVRDGMQAVGRGHLDVQVPVYDGTELGLLQSGFNRMADGLRERERLRDLFGRHVGEAVARAATAGSADAPGAEVELGGETCEASVLFVDLVGSTTYAAQHSPQEVVAVLNRFFGVVVDEVDRQGGLVNKFIGDAVLAVFGVPVTRDDHAGRALAAAREIARRLAEEVTEVGAGVGVATGTVVAGNVGHESRYEYTVIGDAVNSAARLTDLAKDVDGGVLAAAESQRAATAAEQERWTSSGSVRLRGRLEDTDVVVPVRP
ncbi:MAG: hypothetical protein CMH83_10525 [Nocardioides sp.]|nr:hypothetical protein [Nocardioides sp.]